jgi:ribosomal protein S18 acetylase RimI-like enzyme
LLLVARDGEAARSAVRRTPLDAHTTLERLRGVTGPNAEQVAAGITTVLLAAFDVDVGRRAGVIAETMSSLTDPRFMHYLVRRDGVPVAVARRATFDGISYLSSIGTLETVRGVGLGRHVTASSMVDGFDEGSEWIHLGVFAENVPARQLYESLGFSMAAYPGPDMILIR